MNDAKYLVLQIAISRMTKGATHQAAHRVGDYNHLFALHMLFIVISHDGINSLGYDHGRVAIGLQPVITTSMHWEPTIIGNLLEVRLPERR